MFEIESDAMQHTFTHNVTPFPVKRLSVDPATIPPALWSAVRLFSHDTLYTDNSISTDRVLGYDIKVVNTVFRQLLDSIPDTKPDLSDPSVSSDTVVIQFEDIFPTYEPSLPITKRFDNNDHKAALVILIMLLGGLLPVVVFFFTVWLLG